MCNVCRQEFDLRYDLRKHMVLGHETSKEALVVKNQHVEVKPANTAKDKSAKPKGNKQTAWENENVTRAEKSLTKTRRGRKSKNWREANEENNKKEVEETEKNAKLMEEEEGSATSAAVMGEDEKEEKVCKSKQVRKRRKKVVTDFTAAFEETLMAEDTSLLEEKEEESIQEELVPGNQQAKESKPKRVRKRRKESFTDAKEETKTLMTEGADMEEEEEGMDELMGTNLHWDQGKQERYKRTVLEEGNATVTNKQLLATTTNKQMDDATTNKQLWGAGEDSGWYASSDKIISRSRNKSNVFRAFISIFQYILRVHFNISIYSERSFHEIENQCVVRFHLKDLNLQFDKTSFSKKVSLHFNKFSHHQSLYNKHYSFQDKFLSYICPYLRAVNPTAKVRLTLYTYT